MKFLGNEFDMMPVSEWETLVFNIINDNTKKTIFNQDVKYEDLMNASYSKQSSTITPN